MANALVQAAQPVWYNEIGVMVCMSKCSAGVEKAMVAPLDDHPSPFREFKVLARRLRRLRTWITGATNRGE